MKGRAVEASNTIDRTVSEIGIRRSGHERRRGGKMIGSKLVIQKAMPTSSTRVALVVVAVSLEGRVREVGEW